LLGLATGDDDLPGLAVAPGRSALRRLQDPLDDRARHSLRPERAAGKALGQQFLEHTDPFLRLVQNFHRLAHFRAPDAAHHNADAQRPLVGILLNGTSLSTRISPGRPSTRSAMMLRRISSVPPAMRAEGDDISMAWNWPAASVAWGSASMSLTPRS